MYRDDYGVRALQSIVDMVKVMDFALADGKVSALRTLRSRKFCKLTKDEFRSSNANRC